MADTELSSLGSVIKIAYEGEADTNAFTDANVTTLGAALQPGGALGTPSSGVATNLTGTAAGLTAGTVTTNANLTGGVTSVGNAATVVTNANLTGIVTSTGNATAIADKAIALAKLADGTAGNLITYSAGGVIAPVTTGTAKQVLTSNGAGVAPTFQGVVLPIMGAASDETTALTVGTAKLTYRMPFAMTLSAVRCNVTTAPTGSTLIVNIKQSGTTILSTNLSIDATQKTSTTATTPAVISVSSLTDDAQITIDIVQKGASVAGAGLKVTLIGVRT